MMGYEKRVRKKGAILRRKGLLKDRILFRGQITLKKKRNFYYMLSFYLKSRLPILEALDLLYYDTKLSGLSELKERIRNGSCLADALRQSGLADEFMYSCLMLGENMGDYSGSLDRIVEYLDQRDENQKYFVRVTSYPMLLFFMMLVLLSFIIFVIAPQIYHTISSMGASIPWSLRFFYSINLFLVRYRSGILFLIFFAAGTSYLYRGTVKRHIQRFVFRRKLLWTIYRMFLVRSIVWQMEVLFDSGISMLEILSIIRSSSEQPQIQEILREMMLRLNQGASLQESMEESKFFPPAIVTYIRLGESTGSLRENLHSAVMYSNIRVTDLAENTKRVIQPALIMIAGAMISLILALVLPIIQSITYMGGVL